MQTRLSPVITIPVGMTNVPYTAARGGGFGGGGGGGPMFEVGRKIAIGYGSTFPAVANTIAKYEVVTVTAVGKPGTQAAGFQGTPNQWFGGPALGGNGAIVLRSAAGLVVDSLNYGELADPWATEGYQGTSPGGGCFAPSPGTGGGFGGGRVGPAAGATSRSSGRFPDGADTDSNCNDFSVQTASSLAADSAAAVNSIKVSRVADFSVGQAITVDVGANQETAVVASISGGRGPFGGFGGGRGGPGNATITVTAPLKNAHAADAQVSGTGITLTTALAKRAAFPEFNRWMFMFESGDRWHPRSLVAAQAKAVELVGQTQFDAALVDPWIERYLQTSIRIYGATSQSGNGAIPKLVFGSCWVIPQPNDANDLVLILQDRLAVPKP